MTETQTVRETEGDRDRHREREWAVGWTRMRWIMRHFFYPPALCVCSTAMIRLFSPGPHYLCTWTRANNEFIEIEKCRALNCMYLVTQTEAMAWEWLVSEWHHLSCRVDSIAPLQICATAKHPSFTAKQADPPVFAPTSACVAFCWGSVCCFTSTPQLYDVPSEPDRLSALPSDPTSCHSSDLWFRNWLWFKGVHQPVGANAWRVNQSSWLVVLALQSRSSHHDVSVPDFLCTKATQREHPFSSRDVSTRKINHHLASSIPRKEREKERERGGMEGMAQWMGRTKQLCFGRVMVVRQVHPSAQSAIRRCENDSH